MKSIRSTPAYIKTVLFLSAIAAFPAVLARGVAHAPENLVDAIEKFARG